jgi:predicted kinase
LRPNFYRAIYTIAEENLKTGNSVLLDVPHVKEMQIFEWRRFIKNLAARTNSKLVVIRCRCSEKVLRSRLQSRGEKRDRWKLDHWNEFLTQQPIDITPAFSYVDIDTEKDLSKNVKAALRDLTSQQKQHTKQPFRSSNRFRASGSPRVGSALSVNRF